MQQWTAMTLLPDTEWRELATWLGLYRPHIERVCMGGCEHGSVITHDVWSQPPLQDDSATFLAVLKALALKVEICLTTNTTAVGWTIGAGTAFAVGHTPEEALLHAALALMQAEVQT